MHFCLDVMKVGHDNLCLPSSRWLSFYLACHHLVSMISGSLGCYFLKALPLIQKNVGYKNEFSCGLLKTEFLGEFRATMPIVRSQSENEMRVNNTRESPCEIVHSVVSVRLLTQTLFICVDLKISLCNFTHVT